MTTPIGDPVARAFAAYFSATAKTDELYMQPASSSGLRTANGHDYVVLENGNGVLAVYRVRNDGVLRRMKRWPKEIEES